MTLSPRRFPPTPRPRSRRTVRNRMIRTARPLWTTEPSNSSGETGDDPFSQVGRLALVPRLESATSWRGTGAVAGPQARGDDLRLPLIPASGLHALHGGGNLGLDGVVGSGLRLHGEFGVRDVEAGHLGHLREVLRRLRDPPALRLQQQPGFLVRLQQARQGHRSSSGAEVNRGPEGYQG